MAGHARAVCDEDGDGFAGAHPGCFPVRDCDDSVLFGAYINPGEYEDPDSTVDDNCDGRRGLIPMWIDGHFPPSQWATSGAVAFLSSGGAAFDLMRVGDTAATSISKATRSVSIPLNVAAALSVKVSADEGTGVPCTITAQIGGGWLGDFLPGEGVHVIGLGGAYAIPATLTALRVQCPAHRRVTIDWIQVQDDLEEFGPPGEATVTWRDTRNPIADEVISLVPAADGRVWFGTDTSGLGVWDSAGWHASNGEGNTSLMMGGTLGVSGILPIGDQSGEVFALTGDASGETSPFQTALSNNDDGGYATTVLGGFWRSNDDGASWEQLGSTMAQWPPTVTPPATPNYTDDVGGYNLITNCPGAHMERTWEHGGGQHLQPQSLPATAGEPVYIANDAPYNIGVSLWDGSSICPLPHIGDALPHAYVGALLRVDTEGGSQALVVGYRARIADLDDSVPTPGSTLFVCQLHANPTCAGGNPASCHEVTVANLAEDEDFDEDWFGADVRDLQEDLWHAYSQEAPAWAGVLVADGGARPASASTYEENTLTKDVLGDGAVLQDGIGDAECTYEHAGIHELRIADAPGGGLEVSFVPWLASIADFPQLEGEASLGDVGDALTGISMDPYGEWVFAHVPANWGRHYEIDRMYRILADDLFNATGWWQPVNTGELGHFGWETDTYEAWRKDNDLYVSESPLGSTADGSRAAPFPSRSAPGPSWDSVWLDTADSAILGSGVNLWYVWGLADDWSDDLIGDASSVDTGIEPEGDVRFYYLPAQNANELAFQGVPVAEVATGPDGHVWSAVGDEGLVHYSVDAGTLLETSTVDCLWDGWNTSANSVVVVPREDPEEGPAAPVVWATLAESWSPQFMGVVRTTDNGTTWRYAGAGWDGMAVDDLHAGDGGHPEYGARVCVDYDRSHMALQFDPTLGAKPPSNAFSTADPSRLGDLQDGTFASYGHPMEVRALNEHTAVVLFGPTSAADAGGLYTTDGGLYVTIDDGSTWHAITFDGGAESCDERVTYGAQGNGTLVSFELVHPGVDSVWEGVTGSATYDLLYTVGGLTYSVPSACSLARVRFTVSPTTADPVAATWTWYSYPAVAGDDPAACAVAPHSLVGAVPSATGDDAMLFGSYSRTGGGVWNHLYGGACLFDLDTVDLGASLTMIVDPTHHVQDISAVASHPQVADLWALLPSLSAWGYGECATWDKNLGPAFVGGHLDCDYPWPLLVQGNASGFSVTRTMGYPALAFAGPQPVSYPVGKAKSAAWSELSVPDASADGTGSYLIVGTLGQGTWRGELTW